MTPAGNAEIVRRLDELATDLRGLRADLDKTYVRQDVYRADQRLAEQERRETATGVMEIADHARQKAKEVEGRVSTAERDRANLRRLIALALFSAFASPIATALIARAVS